MLPYLHELKSNNIKSVLYYNFNKVKTFTLNNIIIKRTIFVLLNLQPPKFLIFDFYLMLKQEINMFVTIFVHTT
jgi:hypothetical protein